MTLQRYIVTGANKGIGLAIVRRILLDIPHSFVYLGSRNVDNGNQAKKKLSAEKADFGKRIMVVPIDVANDESVLRARELVEASLTDGSKVVGLVNNAGVFGGYDFAAKLNINVKGIVRVTDTFAPLLEDNARVVNITSGGAPMTVEKFNEEHQKLFIRKDITVDEVLEILDQVNADRNKLHEFGLPKDKLKDDMTEYGFSKALANCLTIAQSNKYERFIVNACTPGMIYTDMTNGFVAGGEEAAKKAGWKSPDEGTKSCMRLLTEEGLKARGVYFGSDAKRSPMHRYRSPGDPEYDSE